MAEKITGTRTIEGTEENPAKKATSKNTEKARDTNTETSEIETAEPGTDDPETASTSQGETGRLRKNPSVMTPSYFSTASDPKKK